MFPLWIRSSLLRDEEFKTHNGKIGFNGNISDVMFFTDSNKMAMNMTAIDDNK